MSVPEPEPELEVVHVLERERAVGPGREKTGAEKSVSDELAEILLGHIIKIELIRTSTGQFFAVRNEGTVLQALTLQSAALRLDRALSTDLERRCRCNGWFLDDASLARRFILLKRFAFEHTQALHRRVLSLLDAWAGRLHD